VSHLSVLQRLRDLFSESGIEYRELHHEPTPTSEDAARVRGVDLSTGGKALLLKVGGEFRLFVLSASQKIDSEAIRNHFHVRKTRFATVDELREMTGLAPGAVPPFGKPVLPLDLYLDTSILANEVIAFNAGSLTDSIFLSVVDYLNVAGPTVFPFSQLGSRSD
jgi:prolyl-tRNA editing enzyme YbaK/EbsC (Cys-tRNA(Pro) deacylase)